MKFLGIYNVCDSVGLKSYKSFTFDEASKVSSHLNLELLIMFKTQIFSRRGGEAKKMKRVPT